MFEHGYEFKRDFTPLLMDSDIKLVLTSFKKPQDNAPVERVHQVILNTLVTKDIDNKIFNHIDPWGETLASIAWVIRYSYNRTIIATPGQYVFGKDMIFNLTSVTDWRVITARKQGQVDIDNACKNTE